jgi:hypothetical protein
LIERDNPPWIDLHTSLPGLPEDQPGPEGPRGAQLLVLDGPGARWRVDHGFDERTPDGRPRDLAVSALEEVTFATDGSSARLPSPVSLLIAAICHPLNRPATPSEHRR